MARSVTLVILAFSCLASFSPTAVQAQSPSSTLLPVISASATLMTSTTSVEAGQTVTLTATVRNDSPPGVGFAPARFVLRGLTQPGKPLVVPQTETIDGAAL